MKILCVLDTFYPKVDGPATVINNLARILSENNLAQVDVLAPKYPKYKDNFKFNVIRCASIPGPDNYRAGLPLLNVNLKKLLKKEKYDIIHIHSPFTIGNYAVNFARKNNIPTITTIHTKYKSDFERTLKSRTLQNFMMKYISKVLNKSDYVLTVSNGFAKEINEVYGYSKKVNVIRNATEFKDNKDLSQYVNEIKNKHNLKDEFICLFVGRVVENKNIQFSLEALKNLKESGINNFKFIIVGEGNYKDELMKLTKEYNLEENVIFAGLITNRDYLGAYYKLADLFMFPSIFDTCGIVALEASSFGLPSIMLDGSCASELIENGKNGFVVSNNPIEWSKIIAKLINDRSIIKNMKDHTRKSLNKSWEEIALEYFNYYKIVNLFHKLKTAKNKTKELLRSTTRIKKAKYIKSRFFRAFRNK